MAALAVPQTLVLTSAHTVGYHVVCATQTPRPSKVGRRSDMRMCCLPTLTSFPSCDASAVDPCQRLQPHRPQPQSVRAIIRMPPTYLHPSRSLPYLAAVSVPTPQLSGSKRRRTTRRNVRPPTPQAAAPEASTPPTPLAYAPATSNAMSARGSAAQLRRRGGNRAVSQDAGGRSSDDDSPSLHRRSSSRSAHSRRSARSSHSRRPSWRDSEAYSSGSASSSTPQQQRHARRGDWDTPGATPARRAGMPSALADDTPDSDASPASTRGAGGDATPRGSPRTGEPVSRRGRMAWMSTLAAVVGTAAVVFVGVVVWLNREVCCIGCPMYPTTATQADGDTVMVRGCISEVASHLAFLVKLVALLAVSLVVLAFAAWLLWRKHKRRVDEKKAEMDLVRVLRAMCDVRCAMCDVRCDVRCAMCNVRCAMRCVAVPGVGRHSHGV